MASTVFMVIGEIESGDNLDALAQSLLRSCSAALGTPCVVLLHDLTAEDVNTLAMKYRPRDADKVRREWRA